MKIKQQIERERAQEHRGIVIEMMLDDTSAQHTAVILVPDSLRTPETTHPPQASHDLSGSTVESPSSP
jgi:hypothetical protein